MIRRSLHVQIKVDDRIIVKQHKEDNVNIEKIGNKYRITVKPIIHHPAASSSSMILSPSGVKEVQLKEIIIVDEEKSYFQKLPLPLIEQIFGQIHFVYLKNLRLVCKMFNSVISDCSTIRWQKNYYELKLKDSEIAMPETKIEDCFQRLIFYVAFNYRRKLTEAFEVFAAETPQCQTARLFLQKRFTQEVSGNGWCVLAVVVLTASTVIELYRILAALLQKNCCSTEDDLREFLFCMATFLLHFTRKLHINGGIHYRLYSVIYHLFVNNPKIPMTFEQVQFLNHKLQPNQRVKLLGYAGSGKTHMISEFCKKNSHLRILRIGLTATTFQETADSLAYAAVGKYYEHKLVPELKLCDILPEITVPDDWCITNYKFTQYVLKTLLRFFNSTDRVMNVGHVVRQIQGESQREKILSQVTRLWDKMRDRSNGSCKISRDAFLKIYQVSEPNFESLYDCIVMDEVDNEMISNIVLSQKSIPVIMAGDDLFKSFLPSVKATHLYRLTHAFRYGPEIAYVASCCAEQLASSKSTIIGSLKESCADGTVVEGQRAIITVTERELLSEVIRLCYTNERKIFEPLNFKGAFIGGIARYNLEQLLDIYKLKCNSSADSSYGTAYAINDTLVNRFSHYNELVDYNNFTHDADVTWKIALIHQYEGAIIPIVESIKLKCCYSLEEADVVFGTARESRNFEFDTVLLQNDFQMGNGTQDDEEMLYVAVTRAKKFIVLNEAARLVLLRAREKFKCILRRENLLRHQCHQCLANFTPDNYVSYQNNLITNCQQRVYGSGPLCEKCATTPLYTPTQRQRQWLITSNKIKDYENLSMQLFVRASSTHTPYIRGDDFPDEDSSLFVTYTLAPL